MGAFEGLEVGGDGGTDFRQQAGNCWCLIDDYVDHAGNKDQRAGYRDCVPSYGHCPTTHMILGNFPSDLIHTHVGSFLILLCTASGAA